MENTSYIALSRQAALWRQLDVVAGNLANMNTPSYKNEQMMFREYLVDTRSSDKLLGTKLAYVQDFGLLRDTRAGALQETGNTLDFAMANDDGYFQIETEGGMRYTRNGRFRVDENGMLVNAAGYAVMGQGDSPIIFAPNEVNISVAPDGTVSTENGVVAQMKVVKFEDQQMMRKVGDSLYETNEQPQELTNPQIAQYMVESSNVQAVSEITTMTKILREYQSIQQLIDKEHERQMNVIQTMVPRNG